jgi:anaerobic carbon-monoxide dehydrogenase iron sulfur subunit
MRLKMDKSKCTGCLICEITCSLTHCGQVQREASAIRVKLGHLDHELHQPVVCRQCKRMLCLKSEGKTSDDTLRQTFFWENNRQRQTDCAFDALFASGDRLVHCNLCGGDPECVKSCPTGALQLSA